MNKQEAKELLEKHKEILKKNLKKYERIEKKIDEEEVDILGPKNDIEYQKMLKDLKESKNDKD